VVNMFHCFAASGLAVSSHSHCQSVRWRRRKSIRFR
jgi:hypothetical protein